MKTILTIGGNSYLVPARTDPSKVLEHFQGLIPVRGETVYGPEGTRYTEPYHFSAEVLDAEPARLRVELVGDKEVITREEWNRRVAKQQDAVEAWKAEQAGKPVVAAIPEAILR